MRPPITTIDDLLAAARCCLLSVWTEAAGAGDTAVHSSDAPSDDYMDRLPKFSGAEEATGAWGRGGKNLVGKAVATPWHMEAVADQRVLPFAPSEKKPPLAGSEHELADPAAGTFTQKRRLSSSWEWEREPREAVTLGGSASAASKVREEDRELPEAQAVAAGGGGVRGHEEAHHARHGRQRHRPVHGRAGKVGGGHGGRLAGARRGHVQGGRDAWEPRVAALPRSR